jgi:hypothetical protein
MTSRRAKNFMGAAVGFSRWFDLRIEVCTPTHGHLDRNIGHGLKGPMPEISFPTRHSC